MSMISEQICARVENILDSKISELEAVKTSILGYVNQLKTLLRSYTHSTIDKIEEARNRVNENMNKFNLPWATQDAITEVENILRKCSILSKEFPDILSVYRSVRTTLESKSVSIFNDLISDLNELPIINLIDKIEKLIGTNGFDAKKLLGDIYSAIDCIEAACGSYLDISGKLERINYLLKVCYLTPDGKFDFSALYADEGLSIEQIDSINMVKDIYSTVMKASSKSLQKGIDFVKKIY